MTVGWHWWDQLVVPALLLVAAAPLVAAIAMTVAYWLSRR